MILLWWRRIWFKLRWLYLVITIIMFNKNNDIKVGNKRIWIAFLLYLFDTMFGAESDDCLWILITYFLFHFWYLMRTYHSCYNTICAKEAKTTQYPSTRIPLTDKSCSKTPETNKFFSRPSWPHHLLIYVSPSSRQPSQVT